VSDFWGRVLIGNKSVARSITEKDRPILNYLQDIKLELHADGFGFTLNFDWEVNHYFDHTTLTKSFFMSRPNVIEKCVGTEITWKQGCDPTHVKKTKKKNKKKVTVHEKIPSFFDIFQTLNFNKEEEAEKEAKEDDSEDGDDTAQKMDEDMDLGNEIKDNIIPLALEIYLGVVEIGESDDEEDDEDDDDMDDMPKMPIGLKMPKGMGGGKGGKGGKGPKPEDCK